MAPRLDRGDARGGPGRGVAVIRLWDIWCALYMRTCDRRREVTMIEPLFAAVLLLILASWPLLIWWTS